MSEIRCLLLQVEQVLVKSGALYPHVLDALAGLRRFETVQGSPLRLGLLSTSSPEERPWARLEELGVSEIFEPRELIHLEHADKPPRRALLEDALRSLGAPRGLETAALVTASDAWIAALGDYGMEGFRFGPSGSGARSFDDWAEGPLRIARGVFRDVEANLRAGLDVYLDTREGMQLVSIDEELKEETITGAGKKWFPLRDGRLADMNGLLVQLPVRFLVRFDEDERVHLETTPPEPEALEEAVSFVLGLQSRGSIQEEAGAMRPGCTHSLERDSAGRPRLVRKRYSAI